MVRLPIEQAIGVYYENMRFTICYIIYERVAAKIKFN